MSALDPANCVAYVLFSGAVANPFIWDGYGLKDVTDVGVGVYEYNVLEYSFLDFKIVVIAGQAQSGGGVPLLVLPGQNFGTSRRRLALFELDGTTPADGFVQFACFRIPDASGLSTAAT